MGGFEVVLAHAGGMMPSHDQIMLLMPIVPLLLIGSVLLANALDGRGAFAGHAQIVGLGVPLVAIAAGLSLGAAAIHFSVVESHFDEFAPYGLVFLGVASFQVIWALVYLLRPGSRVALLGAAVNAGVVVAWLASRTIGLPFGPEAGIPQAPGFADLLATAFELLLIGILVAAMLPAVTRRMAAREMTVQKAFVLAAFCTATVIAMTAVALLTSPQGAVASL